MSLARDIENAESVIKGKARLDTHCKQILANKHILGRILWHTMKEYQNLPVADVCQYIEGNPKINDIPVYPGESNAQHVHTNDKYNEVNIEESLIDKEVAVTIVDGDAREGFDYLEGLNTENNIPNEGKVFYDIRFRAYQPKDDDYEEILVDVEGQTTFSQSRIEARSVFYCGRMLSAQLSREFKSPRYEDMKKVYSIWVCMNVPQRIGNAISTLQLSKEHLVSQVSDFKQAYDKMSIIFICLNGEPDGKNELTDLLNTIFSEELSYKEKIYLLESQFHIPMEEKFVEEMKDMCDYSEYYIQAGLRKGREVGVKQGIKQGVKDTIQKIVFQMLELNFSDEDIMNATEINEETFQELKTMYIA